MSVVQTGMSMSLDRFIAVPSEGAANARTSRLAHRRRPQPDQPPLQALAAQARERVPRRCPTPASSGDRRKCLAVARQSDTSFRVGTRPAPGRACIAWLAGHQRGRTSSRCPRRAQSPAGRAMQVRGRWRLDARRNAEAKLPLVLSDHDPPVTGRGPRVFRLPIRSGRSAQPHPASGSTAGCWPGCLAYPQA